MATETVILGIDPGSTKIGVAAVGRDGAINRRVVPVERLEPAVAELVAGRSVRAVALGDGTAADLLRERLVGLLAGTPVILCDETGTTLAGRARYWREHPPRGLWRLIPTTLRLPPVPIDDWAAVILAERLWRELEGEMT